LISLGFLSSFKSAFTAVLKAEEERFFETLEIAMTILDTALAGGVKELPGDVAFQAARHLRFPAGPVGVHLFLLPNPQRWKRALVRGG